MVSMTAVACRIVRWVANDPWPGLVEAELVDAAERRWTFVDKSTVFSADPLSTDSAFPTDGVIRCEVVESYGDTVLISTARPDGLESGDSSTFVVPSSALS